MLLEGDLFFLALTRRTTFSYTVKRNYVELRLTRKRSDGIVKVFYLRSTTDLTLPISVVVLDLNQPSDGGSTYLALDSVVATTTLSSGPSVELRLDLGRPDGSGEARCKLFKGRSSARFL